MSYKSYKIALVALLVFLPVVVAAQTTPPDKGLVPCTGVNCTLCDFFKLFQNIFNYAVQVLAPAVAVIGIAWGGYMFLIAGGRPDYVSQGRKIILNTVIGFVIVYAAYAIASTAVWFIATETVGEPGQTKFGFNFSRGTFDFSCAATSPALSGVGGPISVNLKEEPPKIGEGALVREVLKSNSGVSVGTVAVSDSGVVINKLTPQIQVGLNEASKKLAENNVELVVASGFRDVAKQVTLAVENCKDPTAGECAPLPGKPAACIPKDTDNDKKIDGLNCPHVAGKAVDVWGRQNGKQCDRNSNCQAAVIRVMKSLGFCVLNTEPWHFEYAAHRVSAGCG